MLYLFFSCTIILFQWLNSENLTKCLLNFFPYFFLVKDLRTGTILMRGVDINDIYYAAIFSLQKLPRINSTIFSNQSINSWHHKLGHPSTNILKFLLNRLGRSCNKNSAISFHCDSFYIKKPQITLWAKLFYRHQTFTTGVLRCMGTNTTFKWWLFLLCHLYWFLFTVYLVISNETQVWCFYFVPLLS